MKDEISHIAQWIELSGRAANFGLELSFDSDNFFLRKQGTLLGQYLTLADLRAGISDYVAGERAAGRMKT
jgi:hypothetical protein